MIHRYRSGNPLAIGAGGWDGTALFNPGLRGDILFPRDQQILAGAPGALDPTNGTSYLNPEAFRNPPLTANNVPIRFGNSPRYLSNLRGFMYKSEDFSLLRRTALPGREGTFFELRMDAINVFNRVELQDPNTNASDPISFGKIFGKTGGPRVIQFTGRFEF